MHPLKRIHLSLCYVIFLSDKEIEITAFDQKKYNRLAVLKILFISIFYPKKQEYLLYLKSTYTLSGWIRQWTKNDSCALRYRGNFFWCFFLILFVHIQGIFFSFLTLCGKKIKTYSSSIIADRRWIFFKD